MSWGGGPQGSSVGILEYLSQSNDSASTVPLDDRYKFVDDPTFLEIINLMNIGLASHNVRRNVPNHIANDYLVETKIVCSWSWIWSIFVM